MWNNFSGITECLLLQQSLGKHLLDGRTTCRPYHRVHVCLAS